MKEEFTEEFQKDMKVSSVLWITSVSSWKMAGVRKKEMLPRKGKRLPDTLVIKGLTRHETTGFKHLLPFGILFLNKFVGFHQVFYRKLSNDQGKYHENCTHISLHYLCSFPKVW